MVLSGTTMVPPKHVRKNPDIKCRGTQHDNFKPGTLTIKITTAKTRLQTNEYALQLCKKKGKWILIGCQYVYGSLAIKKVILKVIPMISFFCCYCYITVVWTALFS